MANIKVKYKDKVEEYPAGIRILDIVRIHAPEFKHEILAAKADNNIAELGDVLLKDCKLDFLTMESYEARRIYARSLCFVLIRAAEEVFPGCAVSIEHSINKGLYGEIQKIEELDCDDVKLIENRMRQIIFENVQFEKQTVSMEQALEIFNKYGQKDKLRLFQIPEGRHC